MESYLNIISSFIVAVATVVYVILTYKILKHNKRINDELVRPYVIAKIYNLNNELTLEFANIGKRMAYNLKLDFIPDLDELSLKTEDKKIILIDYKRVLSQSSLAPGHVIKSFLNFGFHFLENKDKEKQYIYNVSISYNDSEDNKYSEKFIINLDNIIYEKQGANFNEIVYLESISKSLKEISELFKNKK